MKCIILYLKLLLLSSSLFWLISCGGGSHAVPATDIETHKLYGVTVDDISNMDQIVDAVSALPVRMTTRIVFDEDVPAEEYLDALNRLKPHSDLMGEILDSFYIKTYTLNRYEQRVDEYLNLLGGKVDIWEIGNEVNGKWTGDPDTVVAKIQYAYQRAKEKGYKTALTLYYNDYEENDGCWEVPSEKMRLWAEQRLPEEIKNGIDYLLISYYEEDCDGHKPTVTELNTVFKDLGDIFPNAKLGFGEAGTTTTDKAAYLTYYYTLPINHPRYIGGYFWWYFKEDMVPKTKALWQTLYDILKSVEQG